MSNQKISPQPTPKVTAETLVQESHSQAKLLEYKSPVLKEHGNAKDVTLQTFFGTFSPPPGH
jgi:hypothetical protein